MAYIAIDIGGTHIRIGLAKSLLVPEFEEIIKMPILNIYQHDIRNILHGIHELTHGKHIDCLGISIAGILNTERTMVLRSPHLSSWERQPFVEEILASTKTHIVAANDATAGTLAEGLYVEYPQKKSLYVVWGSGIGGSVLEKDLTGIRVQTCEPGHQIYLLSGLKCHCGQRGCYEAYIGGKNAEERLHIPLEELPDSEWDEMENIMAQMLINMVYTNPTQLIILGGGVSINQKQRITHIQAKMRSMMHFYPAPLLRAATFDDNNGIVGALGLMQERVSILSYI